MYGLVAGLPFFECIKLFIFSLLVTLLLPLMILKIISDYEKK